MDRSRLARARALLADHPVVDGHNDLAWELREQVNYDLRRRDIAEDQSAHLHTDLPRLRGGGVGAQFWSVYVRSDYEGDRAVSGTLEQIDFVRALARKYPDDLRLATTAEDIEQARRDGVIASLLGAEGGHSIACSLATLRTFAELGVRYLTLTHNDNVPWADSATDQPAAEGLTRFGEEVVREMNRLGMLADLSHVAAATMRDSLRVSRAPVLFSHSSARGVCDHPRNIPDDVLESLPANGGVAMATFVSSFVLPAGLEWTRAVDAETRAHGFDPEDPSQAAHEVRRAYEAAHPRPTADVTTVADHLDHMRETAGIEHIGLGGDFDGTSSTSTGLEDVAGYPNLIAELLDRGWSSSDLAKLTWDNAVRVLRDAEDVARDLRQTEQPSIATVEQLDR